ncbi:MAG: hypothetical protein AAGF12_25650 [Myxococcota bacterium]
MRALVLVFFAGSILSGCVDDPLEPGGTDGGSEAQMMGCEPPQEMCGSQCINTQADARHCGECNNQCPAGNFCNMGTCGAACSGSLMACGTSCVDVARDRSHCGRCDNACGPDQDCRGGACGCPEGYSECDGVCVDTNNDGNNCGVCGRMCSGGDVCRGGTCTCGAGAREDQCENGVDDDCDLLVDCEDPDCMGAMRGCMGVCGPGVETCDGAGMWGMCEGGDGSMEICGDGIDQDCDGTDPRNPDAWEPNDSCSTCKLLSMQTDPEVTINARFDSVEDRVDCYRITTDDNFNGPERVVVRLTDIPEFHDYDVYLYRGFDDCESNDWLARGINFNNADEELSYSERFGFDDGGDYYIRVRRYRGQSCTDDYTLYVNGLKIISGT